MNKISPIAHNFYDKKRRINYIRIKKELEGSQFRERVRIHESDSSASPVSDLNESLKELIPPELKINLKKET
jgi:hypothetical protein